MADSGTEKEYHMQDPAAEAQANYEPQPTAEQPVQPFSSEKHISGMSGRTLTSGYTGADEKEYRHDFSTQAHAGTASETTQPNSEVGSTKYEESPKIQQDNGFSKEVAPAGGYRSSSEDEGYGGAPLEQTTTRGSKVPVNKWKRWLTFRSSKIPPIPETRIVSREAAAGFFSVYTFQWIHPLMFTGYQRPLEVNDLWLVNPKRSAHVLADKLKADFKAKVEAGSKRPLLAAMYQTFKFEFLLGGACQLVVAVVQVINPFLLRYLISFAQQAYRAEYDGGPGPQIGRGVGLVIGITLLQLIQSGCQNQFLYRGQANGGQARAALICLIFDKSMKISGRARSGGKVPGQIVPDEVKPGSEEEKKWFKKMLPGKKAKKIPGKAEADDGWSNGRIINLMSTDTYRVDQASGMFHMTWTAPIQIVIVLVLLIINISYSALAGFALIFATMPLLAISIKSLFSRRKRINKITDQRVSLTQEILHAVRFVKYFGWETSFLERLEAIRSREIRSIQWLMAIRNAINAISMSIPIFASMLSFICYSLTSHALNPAYIFSSLALFNSIRIPLNMLPLVIGQVVDAGSSVQRIQEFLMAEDAKDEAEWDMEHKTAIDVSNASFSWEQTRQKEAASTTPEDEKAEKVQLKAAKKAAKEERRLSKAAGRDFSRPGTAAEEEEEQQPPFMLQDLNFSVGRNELIAIVGAVGCGKSSLLAALAGDMRKTAGNVTLGASRAFCPQSAWIQNATVQENILFGKEMDEDWYNQVVDACALRPDLEMLPAGDRTEIGERGITVSGGQKQRLNIARAIYFNSDMILMDDPLSAVDAHVGRHIMDNAICGLLSNKCRVLATHQLWTLSRCDRVIWMDGGRIVALDTFPNLMANNPEFAALISTNAQEEKQEEVAKVNDDEVEEEKKDETKAHGGKKTQAALMTIEERATSSVSGEVYRAYLRAAGSWIVLPLLVTLLIVAQGANIVTNLWLSYWTSNRFGYANGVYIGIYAALGFAQAFFQFVFSVALSVYGTNASKVMLHHAMTRVLRAPMSFFDTTPLGRITNRFAKDVDTMDNVLTDAIRFFLMTMGMIVSVFALIIAFYYYFAAALAPLFFLFLFSAGFYRASAREVKRHESVLRSTLFARFSEGVSGISTIRAYGLQPRFAHGIRDAVDDMNSAYFLTFANQRWLSVRLDVIGNILVFVVGILVVTSRFSVNPSTGGLVLSYILSIVQMIQFTVRQLAEVENNMNATERLYHYGHNLDEEPPLHLTEVRPTWPERGEILFNDAQMRYRDGLPLVLRGMNLHVNGGERIGIVGRTGAGKSSIMSVLFRLVELSGGSVSIDGVDISTVGLYDLRSRLAIIPQDPTLFRGTVRSNLDPFGKYTDLELWSALRQSNVVSEDQEMLDHSARIHLDTTVEEEGSNFSLGQRQLMALARALVRGSQIIVCDEATSSVDVESDNKIQNTIRVGFAGKTVLTIAHRIRTILDYDKILVLDQGAVAEFGKPLELFDQGGIFGKMCAKSSIVREDFFAKVE